MKYLKLFCTLLLLITSVAVAKAQNADTVNTWEQRKQQYKADKIAYISAYMEFTVEDAQKFWPIYNKYDAKYDQIFCQRRHAYDQHKFEQMTEAQCAEALDKLGQINAAEQQTQQEYEKELRKVFPAKFVLRYFNAENDFKRKVINRPKYHGQIGEDPRKK